jgi:hypothetical protein
LNTKAAKVKKPTKSSVKRRKVKQVTVAPNLSRKTRGLQLYVFPSFDRCDSLLFFPTTLLRHSNTGDFDSIAKLFKTHVSKDCDAHLTQTPNKAAYDAKFLLSLFERTGSQHPDGISVVHSTKVIENEIHATIYFKHTDNTFIFNSVGRNEKEPRFRKMFPQKRSERLLAHGFELDEALQARAGELDGKEAMMNILDSDVDLIVYGTSQLKLKFDERTNKIVEIVLTGRYNQVMAPSYLLNGDSSSGCGTSDFSGLNEDGTVKDWTVILKNKTLFV